MNTKISLKNLAYWKSEIDRLLYFINTGSYFDSLKKFIISDLEIVRNEMNKELKGDAMNTEVEQFLYANSLWEAYGSYNFVIDKIFKKGYIHKYSMYLNPRTGEKKKVLISFETNKPELLRMADMELFNKAIDLLIPKEESKFFEIIFD